MPQPVFTIHETYNVKGRGLVLFSFPEEPVQVRVGDEIELTTEDARCVRTRVTAVELVHDWGRPGQFPLGIMVSLVPDDDLVLHGAMAHVVG